MKKQFHLIIFMFLLISSCSNNNSKETTKQNEPQQVEIPGKYYWEGSTDIGYGLSATEKITLTIFENGTAKIDEFTKETGESNTIDLQWFKAKDGYVAFGKFETPNPDEKSPGADFIAYPSEDGLTMAASKKFYKRLK